MAAHGSPEDQNRTVSADVYETMAWYGYNTKYNWPGATEAEAMAAPGQLTIPLVANLDFTAGARYEKTEKKLDYRYEESRTDTGERLAYDAYTVDDDSDTFLPKGVLSWMMPPPMPSSTGV